MSDYWLRGTTNRHYHVIDEDITNPRLQQKFDFICCVSTLEHIEDFDAAVEGIYRLLNPGGLLSMSFPYNESSFIENVYKLPGAGYGADKPYICRVYSRSEVDRWMAAHAWRIKAQEYWRVFSGDFWTFGELLRPPLRSAADQPHQLTCLLFEKDA